jgi:hypothetical protein
VLRETTSQGRCELVCPSRTGTREEPGTLTQGGALFSLVPLAKFGNRTQNSRVAGASPTTRRLLSAMARWSSSRSLQFQECNASLYSIKSNSRRPPSSKQQDSRRFQTVSHTAVKGVDRFLPPRAVGKRMIQEAILLETPHAILYAFIQRLSNLRSELRVHEITSLEKRTCEGRVIETRLRLWCAETFFCRRNARIAADCWKFNEISCEQSPSMSPWIPKKRVGMSLGSPVAGYRCKGCPKAATVIYMRYRSGHCPWRAAGPEGFDKEASPSGT